VQKAIDRQARNFWIKPDEKMVRLWVWGLSRRGRRCHRLSAVGRPNFAGILCVDEVYQGDLPLLLAVNGIGREARLGHDRRHSHVDSGHVVARLDGLAAEQAMDTQRIVPAPLRPP
jgi:hypothetical protein